VARVPKMTRGIYCCPNILHLFCPTAFYTVQKVCRSVCTVHISDRIESVYDLLLLPNNTGHCAASLEVVGSIPDGVIGFFIHIILPAVLWS
jgi:hypothetical protein